jgi:hypothetical protein
MKKNIKMKKTNQSGLNDSRIFRKNEKNIKMKKSNGPGFSHSRIFRENEKKHKNEKIQWTRFQPF